MQNDEVETSSSSVETPMLQPVRRYGPGISLVLGCAVVFLSSLFLYSRQNDFSTFYHPDEFEKAKQLITHKRVYLHPELLLEGTNIALKITGQHPPADRGGIRQVILTGRWVSAIFAALTVTAFALVGYAYASFTGFLLTALSVSLCPSILVNAHYMKEDTALLLGIAATFLATIVYSKRPSRATPVPILAFIGIGAALAASGKYVGIVVLIAALIYIGFPWERKSTLRRWGIVLIAFSLTALLINYSIFLDWTAFKTGLAYETNHGLIEHFGGTVMSRPNSFALDALFRETMPHVLVLAGIFLLLFGVFWGTTTRWELFLVAFTVAFAVMISFSMIPLYRYNLPIITLLHLMAALVVAKCALFLKRPVNWIVFFVAISLIGILQTRRCLNYLDQFANDSHVRLRAFLAQHVPAGSNIAADAFAIMEPDDDPRLSEKGRHLPVRLAIRFWAADLGDYDTLHEIADYIVVAETSYGRFFDRHVRPARNDPHYEACRRFYEQLFAHGELVWSSDPHPPTYSFVNPAIRVYRVSAAR